MVRSKSLAFCALMTFSIVSHAFGEGPDLDPAELLRMSAKFGAALPDGPLSSKTSLLTEIAGLQAGIGDEEGSRESIEAAIAGAGSPRMADVIRSDVRRNVLFAKVELSLKSGDLGGAKDALEAIDRLEQSSPSPQPFQTLERLAKLRFRAGDRPGAAAAARAILAKAESLPVASGREGRMAGPQTRAFGMAVASRVFHEIGDFNAAGKVRGLARIPDDANDRSNRVESLSRLLAARAGDGDLVGALEQIESSLDPKLKADPDAKSTLIASVSLAYAPIDEGAALRAASSIPDPLRRFDAKLAIARKLGRDGHWRAASVAWEALDREKIAASTRNFLADLALAQARAGLLEEARGTVDRSLREANRPGGEKFYHETFPSPYFFTRLAETSWVLGDRESADLDLKRAQDLADHSTPDLVRKSVDYNGIGMVLALMGRIDAASRVLAKSTVLDRNELSAALADSAGARIRVGDPDGATQLIDLLASKLQNTRQVAEAVGRVAMKAARDGDPKALLRWAEAQTNNERKAYALCGLARGLIEKAPVKPR